MKAKNLLVYAVLTAILAGLVTLFTWRMNGWPSAAGQPVTYVTFVAWAAYFLFGANIKGAAKALSSMVAGVVAAILMFVLSLAFGYDPWWAVPLAIVILVVPMVFGEKVKIINNVAAIFMGTGLYFSLSAAGAFGDEYTFKTYAIVGLTTLLYIFFGFVAGWITIQFNIFASKLWSKRKK